MIIIIITLGIYAVIAILCFGLFTSSIDAATLSKQLKMDFSNNELTVALVIVSILWPIIAIGQVTIGIYMLIK